MISKRMRLNRWKLSHTLRGSDHRDPPWRINLDPHVLTAADHKQRRAQRASLSRHQGLEPQTICKVQDTSVTSITSLTSVSSVSYCMSPPSPP
uniref:Uncharacterized protein n=1 Tax=Knipowitschia caucasica TaxID=637954 RepID=A0AAV2J2M0_KNICA